MAVGFSLGGNVLAKLLAEPDPVAPLYAAAVVSAPFDLAESARRIDQSDFWPRVYRWWYLRSLLAKARHKARRHPGQLNCAGLSHLTSLQSFDDAVTAPMFGFRNAAEYYQRCSCGPLLGEIRTQTLIVSAEDDPLAPASQLPRAALGNRFLSILTPRHGGHLGFVSGSVARPRFWAEAQVMRFFDARVSS